MTGLTIPPATKTYTHVCVCVCVCKNVLVCTPWYICSMAKAYKCFETETSSDLLNVKPSYITL